MKFCESHYSALKKEIIRKGMKNSFSEDPQDIQRAAVDWLQGKTPRSQINVLVVSLLEIMQKTQGMFGFDEGVHSTQCPICFAEYKSKKELGALWIDAVTDAVLALLVENEVKGK